MRAGLGGIATAGRLARHGYNVTVLEKNEQPGGAGTRSLSALVPVCHLDEARGQEWPALQQQARTAVVVRHGHPPEQLPDTIRNLELSG
jgi:monoamine oxidase